MLKNRVISIFIICTYSTQLLMANSFNDFLNTALEQSPYLKSTYLAKEQLDYEASIATRYQNPEVDILYSKFNSKNEVSDSGYSVSLSQPIRFWGISENKNKLSRKILEGSENFYQMDRTIFIKELSLLYTQYEYNEKLKKLTQESYELAKDIYDISQERYSLGSISQADLLQTEAALLEVKVQNENAKMDALSQYVNLLKFAGITENIDLELNHSFVIKGKKQILNNIELLSMKSRQEINLAKLNVETNTFDSFNFTVSYDKEPEQTVNRIGISIPFPIFNTRSQETQIALLENKKKDLLIQNRENQLNQELENLYKQRDSLILQLSDNEKILMLKNKMLEMYLEKFRISQANILELQIVKDSVIQIKKELLLTKVALNQNAIDINYIQGDINEEITIN